MNEKMLKSAVILSIEANAYTKALHEVLLDSPEKKKLFKDSFKKHLKTITNELSEEVGITFDLDHLLNSDL